MHDLAIQGPLPLVPSIEPGRRTSTANGDLADLVLQVVELCRDGRDRSNRLGLGEALGHGEASLPPQAARLVDRALPDAANRKERKKGRLVIRLAPPRPAWHGAPRTGATARVTPASLSVWTASLQRDFSHELGKQWTGRRITVAPAAAMRDATWRRATGTIDCEHMRRCGWLGHGPLAAPRPTRCASAPPRMPITRLGHSFLSLSTPAIASACSALGRARHASVCACARV